MPGGKGKSTGGKAGPKAPEGKSQKSHSAKAGLQVSAHHLRKSGRLRRGAVLVVLHQARHRGQRKHHTMHTRRARGIVIRGEFDHKAPRHKFCLVCSASRCILDLPSPMSNVPISKPFADQFFTSSFPAVVSSDSSRTTLRTRCVSVPRVSHSPYAAPKAAAPKISCPRSSSVQCQAINVPSS